MSDSDQEVPQLSEHALAALQEFYAEQAAQQHTLTQLQDNAEVTPQEDWQLSQFWYNEATATALAREAVSVAGQTGRVACVSCPTLYRKLQQLKPAGCRAVLLEYDSRFQVFGSDYVPYDYNSPLQLPEELKHACDLVVVDPPFLSEECLSKIAETVKLLAKDKILLCTGAIMEDLAQQLLDVKKCSFVPQHACNLANEFHCFANYLTTELNQAAEVSAEDNKC